MPRNKDQKRIIRSRMKKTGESYTAARARIISKPNIRTPAPRAVDYAALAGMSDEKIAAKTGRTWQEWTRALDGDDAAAMPHREIAVLVHGKYGVGDWWAQTVTVGYERIKGLRDRGQRRGGAYEASKSRTFGVPVNALYDAWADDAVRRRWLDDVAATVRKSTKPKSVRLQWPNGSIIAVDFVSKGPAKSAVTVTQMKLASRSAADQARRDWTTRLDALGSVLESSVR